MDISLTPSKEKKLLQIIANLIEKSRQRVMRTVNSEMMQLYWDVGRQIRHSLLDNKKAEYGKQIIEKLGEELTVQYGKGFNVRNLFHMVRFYDVVPDQEILHALRTKLTWTHLRELIYIEDDLKRSFYMELCRIEGWTTRVLKDRIRSMLYERTAISRKPEKLIKQELAALRMQNSLTEDFFFRDPYLIDFLNLTDGYSEKDLENAILQKLEKFLLELGSEFAFVGRQKRITVANQDFFIDLLFYHRGLHALLVIELKLDKFQPEYKGQIEFYLRYLEKYEMKPGDNPPIGLILCAFNSQEIVELMMLEKDRIKVAEYLTKLPPKHLLEQKLQRVVKEAEEEIGITIEETRQIDCSELQLMPTPLTPMQQQILDFCRENWRRCSQILKHLEIRRNPNF